MGDEGVLWGSNADMSPFWEGCKKQELRFQKCRNCGHVRWPPAVICPRCLSQDKEWIMSEGRGTIYSFVVYHVAFHPAFKGSLPYVTGVVELDEGPSLITNIVDCDPSHLSCDMPVEVVWDHTGDGSVLPKFRPVAI